MPITTLTPVSPSSTDATRVDSASAGALSDQRIAALVDELTDRDERHLAEAASRRPVLWLLAMTTSAIVLAQLAVAIAVAPL